MIFRFVAAIVVGVLAASSSANNDLTNMTFLQCRLDTYTRFKGVPDPKGTPFEHTAGYGFRLVPPEVVDLTSPYVKYEHVRIEDNVVEFESSNRFHNFAMVDAADATLGHEDVDRANVLINRVTGEMSLTFHSKFGPGEEAACRARKDGPWCSHAPITAVATGNCKPVRRRF